MNTGETRWYYVLYVLKLIVYNTGSYYRPFILYTLYFILLVKYYYYSKVYFCTPFCGAAPAAKPNAMAVVPNVTALQVQLGDDDARTARGLALLADTETRLAALGEISKPVHALKFLNNLEYKAVGGQQLQGICMSCGHLLDHGGGLLQLGDVGQQQRRAVRLARRARDPRELVLDNRPRLLHDGARVPRAAGLGVDLRAEFSTITLLTSE